MGYDQYVDGFHDISWPPEEASYLRFSKNIDIFYDQVELFLDHFIQDNCLDVPQDLKRDLLEYQKAVVADYAKNEDITLELKYNLHEYISIHTSGSVIRLKKGDYAYKVLVEPCFNNDQVSFSREIVWYGRKRGKLLYRVESEKNTK